MVVFYAPRDRSPSSNNWATTRRPARPASGQEGPNPRVRVSRASLADRTLGLLGLGRLPGWRGRLLVDIHDRRPFAADRKARRKHKTSHRVDRRWIRPREPPDMAFGREQRGDALFVGLIPDLRIGSTVCQQFHDKRVVVVRGAVHGGVA